MAGLHSSRLGLLHALYQPPLLHFFAQPVHRLEMDGIPSVVSLVAVRNRLEHAAGHGFPYLAQPYFFSAIGADDLLDAPAAVQPRAEVRRQVVPQRFQSAGFAAELDAHVGHVQRGQHALAQAQDQRRLGMAVMRCQFALAPPPPLAGLAHVVHGRYFRDRPAVV